MTDGPILLARDKALANFCSVMEKFGPIARLWEHPDPIGFAKTQGGSVRGMFCLGGQPMLPGLIEALPNLGIICSLASGYEGVPMDLCRERGIIVANSAGSNADDVADIAVAHVLALQTRLFAGHAGILDGTWERTSLRHVRHSLKESRVGVVGMGAIGQCVAERLAPHGCEIAWWGPRKKSFVSFPYMPSLKTLAEWCHILIVAGRADNSNRHMVDQEIIDAVGPEGSIVNVSRGMIIDEDALIASLKSGKLGSAGLDVFEKEPTPAARWQDVPNVLLSPHIGGAGTYSVRRYREIAIENFELFFAGKPIPRTVS